MHDRYGRIVRISPNELSFLDPDAWKDIYGHRTGGLAGAAPMEKYPLFYRTKGTTPSILSETRENHAFLRKQMSNGFSDRSMREQEPIIGGYVELLIARLREHGSEEVYSDEKGAHTKPRAVDIMKWYNWTTFDIIGDLAFGESFGCLQKAEYDPWVASISKIIHSGATLYALKVLHLRKILKPLMYRAFKSRSQHTARSLEKLERRMALEVERSDLVEGLLRAHGDGVSILFRPLGH